MLSSMRFKQNFLVCIHISASSKKQRKRERRGMFSLVKNENTNASLLYPIECHILLSVRQISPFTSTSPFCEWILHFSSLMLGSKWSFCRSVCMYQTSTEQQSCFFWFSLCVELLSLLVKNSILVHFIHLFKGAKW